MNDFITIKNLNKIKQNKMETTTFTCCLCGDNFNGYGNNPKPLPIKNETDRCCDDCNTTVVIERMKIVSSKKIMNNEKIR